MTHKRYYQTVATIFLVIAIVHLLRIVNGWEALIGGVAIPFWASWLALIIAGYLALQGFTLARKE